MKTILLLILLLATSYMNAQDIRGWERVYDGFSIVGKIEFPTPAVGYVVIQPDTLMVTKDTGSTWNKVQIILNDTVKITGITELSFYSGDKGFISVLTSMNKPAIVKISDFGNTTSFIQLPDSITSFLFMKFSNDNHAVCVFSAVPTSKIYNFPVMITNDGAKSWSEDKTGGNNWPLVVPHAGISKEFRVADSSIWFMEFYIPCGAQSLCLERYFTKNAGVNWTGVDCLGCKYIPLSTGYAYNLTRLGYKEKNDFIFSPVFDVRTNTIMDTLPAKLENWTGYAFSECKNGSIFSATVKAGRQFPITIYFSNDTCHTWTRYTEEFINNGRNFTIKEYAVNGKDKAFFSSTLKDTITNTTRGIIYRTRIDTTTVVKENTTEPQLLLLYPNPTDQILRWNIPNGRATITDALGVEVVSVPASSMEADISGLAIGVYYLTIRSGGESVTRMFTVMR